MTVRKDKELRTWDQCKAERIAKDVKPDQGKMSSILELVQEKVEGISYTPMNQKTKNLLVANWYDVARELLEVLALSKGFKVYNHECYTAFLKEVLRENDASRIFDSARKIRNGINYYGKGVSLEDAPIIIEDIKKLTERIKELLKEHK